MKLPLNEADIKKIVSIAKSFGATRVILFGSASENPDEARDLDLAFDGVPGWKLFELGARLEEELRVPLDIVSLDPPSRFTRLIETKGQQLL
ncbi:MAG: DNA polymerase III subunit beta [Deltaproteobacteria bacterium RBG_19FT_COMBO_46_12]|nr:MAG: DNA polymerase III subunit beta [Deltaproteobacteria bacterium RBG_19FT_COMBO_46_12]